jgi:hypothetical protein
MQPQAAASRSRTDQMPRLYAAAAPRCPAWSWRSRSRRRARMVPDSC